MRCDYPIHLDTYRGCSHACKYCFVKNRSHYSLTDIKPLRSKKALKDFIAGKRNDETRWCDWNIPLHWGGNSDPFQECELEYKASLELLEIFAETKYPFIVSTKNPVMLTQEPYLSLIKECECVLQISMACSKYDQLEPGAPTYEERLKAADFLSDKVTRIIARIRPYFPDLHKHIKAELPSMAQSGIYGISVSSYIAKRKTKGMIRSGTSYVFPIELIQPKFKELKELAHKNNLRWFCCEAGLDHTSDELTCCGTENLDKFVPLRYNIPHLAYDDVPPEPTEAMKAKGTIRPFKCIRQSTEWWKQIKDNTFADLMVELGENEIENDRINKIVRDW